MADYYEILQVHPTAEPEVIQAAYRRLSLKYHPDVNSTTTAAPRMKAINEAYAVLADPAKRAKYDRSRGLGLAPAIATPSITVEPKDLDAGTLEAGRPVTRVIHIANQGSGALKGMLVSHVSWIKASPPDFSANELDIAIRLEPNRPGRYSYPKAIEVYSNGGRTSIGVRASVVEAGVKARASAVYSYASDSSSVAVMASRKGSLWPSALWWMSLLALASGVIWYLINPWLVFLPLILGTGILGWRVAPGGLGVLGLNPDSRLRIPGPGAQCRRCNARVISGRSGKCPRCNARICHVCGFCDCGIPWGRKRSP